MCLYRLAYFTKPSNLNRSLATSAQKRKLKRVKMKNSSKRILEAETTVEAGTRTNQDEGKHGFLRPFLFLGVMPLVVSSLIIWSRSDLLQDLTGHRFEPIRKEFKAAQQKQNDEQMEGGQQQTNQQQTIPTRESK
ncbi:unnamed protein product [Cylindrotheca closterium]|uniref:Transmembrane protein n=1 Tax=Cylindrotheca closterium TaxID=2856 RepID=A0AAD2PUC1_9STRA|nr:unnamed protein product [Cylindrotheca closterium]